MSSDADSRYGYNVVANGRNINYLRLITGFGGSRKDHYLTSIQFKFRKDDILIVMKKDTPKGAMICFLEAATIDDALYNMALHIKRKNLPWKPDKWTSMRIDKTG